MNKYKGNRNACKPDDQKCTAVIKIMVTPEEKARIKGMAKVTGMTMKAYLLQGK